MTNKFIFQAVLMLFPTAIYAQQNYSLKECISYGLKNNRNTIIYANEKKAADAKAKEALAAYLPSINLNGSVDDNLKLQQSVIPAGIFGPTPVKVAFTQKFNANTSAQLDQTIYDQSLITGLKANRYNKQQSELNQRKSDENIIYTISTAYYQIYIYREQLALLKSNQGTYHKQMELSRLQVKKGVTLEADLNKIIVNYNNTLSQISVAESNLEYSINQLKNEMGYPLDHSLPLDTTLTATAKGIVPIKNAVTSFEVGNRVDYQLAGVNTKLLEIDQKRIAAGALPKLTAYARYGAVGFGEQLGPALTGLNSFSAIGLKLNIPVFDFFKRNAQSAQAKYKYMNAIEEQKLDETKFRMEYENAKTKLIKAQSSLENDSRNIELAVSVFKVTDFQYQKGVTGLMDWLNAQYSLKEAQNNYLNSLYNFYLAQIDIEKATGTLKNFYNNL